MYIGPSADVAHQATMFSAFRHNCEHMQCVVYSRSAKNDPEALLENVMEIKMHYYFLLNKLLVIKM